jgi:putative colanic acid biosynthesis acetyltransferase WcaF
MTNNLIQGERQVDLSRYDNSWYSTGAGWFKRFWWYYINVLIFKNGWLPMSSIKVSLLRRFGAKIVS